MQNIYAVHIPLVSPIGEKLFSWLNFVESRLMNMSRLVWCYAEYVTTIRTAVGNNHFSAGSKNSDVQNIPCTFRRVRKK
jgi:hypothetical protein